MAEKETREEWLARFERAEMALLAGPFDRMASKDWQADIRETGSDRGADWNAAYQALSNTSDAVWRTAVEMSREGYPFLDLNDPNDLKLFMRDLAYRMTLRG